MRVERVTQMKMFHKVQSTPQPRMMLKLALHVSDCRYMPYMLHRRTSVLLSRPNLSRPRPRPIKDQDQKVQDQDKDQDLASSSSSKVNATTER